MFKIGDMVKVINDKSLIGIIVSVDGSRFDPYAVVHVLSKDEEYSFYFDQIEPYHKATHKNEYPTSDR